MKPTRTTRTTRNNERSRHTADPLEVGQQLHDTQESKDGVVIDTARQYSHPKAAPVYSYLVRWEDGQVQAISEAAMEGPQAVKLVD